MGAIRIAGELGAIQCTGGGEYIPLDAGDLHHAVDRVAGETQVMFQSHLSRILNLADRAAHQLGSRRSRHGASRTDLSLAADLRARDGGVMFDEITDQPGSSQRAQNTRFRGWRRYPGYAATQRAALRLIRRWGQ